MAAAALGSEHRVALIERGVLGRTTKFWVSTVQRLERHGFGDCLLHRASAIVAGTFLGGHVIAPGDLAVVNDLALLSLLADRCRQRGVILNERCTLLNLSWMHDRVRANTTGDSYNARVIIDTSGGLSSVASTFRLHRLDGFYAVHGAHLRYINLHRPEIVLAYIDHLGDPAPVFEVVPTGEDSAYCAVFTCTKRLPPPQALHATFAQYCRHNPFFAYTTHTKQVATKVGAIPIGRLRRKRLPAILPFGEAGLIQPPLLGTAFNEILDLLDGLGAHVSKVLANPARTARLKYPLLKRTQDRLQLALVRLLIDANVEAFDRLVRFMASLPPQTVFKLCSNELKWKELAAVASRLPQYLFASARSVRDHLGKQSSEIE